MSRVTGHLPLVSQIFFCPSFKTESQLEWERIGEQGLGINWTILTYGFNNTQPHGTDTVFRAGRNRTVGVWMPQRIEKPADQWLLVDSVCYDMRPDPVQHSRLEAAQLQGAGARLRGVHMRHSNQANMIFWDGHVETVRQSRLEEVEPVAVSRVYTQDHESVNF